MITINHLPLRVALDAIPIATVTEACSEIGAFLSADSGRHVLHMIGIPHTEGLRIVVILADDHANSVLFTSYVVGNGVIVPSLTTSHPQMHIFERDLWERHGVQYADHPWCKPVRYPMNSSHRKSIDDYPFFRLEGGESHEVGVGPIHAGVIEPGHFRFQCTGEDVVHLEIKLGYQHRDVEGELERATSSLQRSVLAESIAGDTTIGHAWAHAMAMEQLSGVTYDAITEHERAIALELERMAIHVGDLGALSLDVAWQLGSAYFGALRTPLINFFQSWCGNRFGKGLIRPGMNRFTLDAGLRISMRRMLDAFEAKFTPLANEMFALPSVVRRFEGTGIVTHAQVTSIGAVGMSARMSGLGRDIRRSHPHGSYAGHNDLGAIERDGDVLARAVIRRKEVDRSMKFIRVLLDELDQMPVVESRTITSAPAPNILVVSAVEAWRGELVHAAITGPDGQIETYRVKDPSMHNWFALALAVRNNEISDFPICNKSFDLSYCGHDL
ncbi:MAG: NADH dehydrogenase subunit [Ignavibacteria bacterium]|nr:NADH dehydrogenase subunit [Ignavibacteria bacterium]